MNAMVQSILNMVKDTADFGYVDFTDINDTNALGDNALHCVIIWGDYENAKILIENGININQKGEEDNTPLHLACSYGHKDIVQLLLDNGADTSARTLGDTPFTTARLSRHDEICELLRNFPTRNDAASEKRQNHLQGISSSIQTLEKKIDENCNRNA